MVWGGAVAVWGLGMWLSFACACVHWRRTGTETTFWGLGPTARHAHDAPPRMAPVCALSTLCQAGVSVALCVVLLLAAHALHVAGGDEAHCAHASGMLVFMATITPVLLMVMLCGCLASAHRLGPQLLPAGARARDG